MNHVTKFKQIKNICSYKTNALIQELVKIHNEFLAEGFTEDQLFSETYGQHLTIQAKRPATQAEKDAAQEVARREVVEQLNTLVTKSYPLVIEQKKAALERYKEKVVNLDQEVKLQNMKKRLAEYENMQHSLWEKMLILKGAPISQLKMELKQHNDFMLHI